MVSAIHKIELLYARHPLIEKDLLKATVKAAGDLCQVYQQEQLALPY